MTDKQATMINYLGQDVLEFSANGKSLGKVKVPDAAKVFQNIATASENLRCKLIRDAGARYLSTTPAGHSAGFERTKPDG